MKTSQCLMDKVIMDLIRMTSLSIGDGIRDHLQPIIAKSSEPVSDLWSGLRTKTLIGVELVLKSVFYKINVKARIC